MPLKGTPVIPSGLIVMWSGLIANIPSGWLICDGGGGTPNLLAKFLEGVATAATNPGTTGGATAKTTAGHTHTQPTHTHTTPSHTLITSEMPAHAHVQQKFTSGSGQSLLEVAAPSATPGALTGSLATASAGSDGGHAHGDTGASGDNATGSNTDGIADIRPLYYDIAFLMKT